MIKMPEEDYDPIALEDAYEALTQEAFAVWVRLLLVPSEDLHKGRAYLSRLLGFSYGRSNQILRELRLKGFLEVFPPIRIGINSSIRITRKGLVAKPSRIIKLGGTLT